MVKVMNLRRRQGGSGNSSPVPEHSDPVDKQNLHHKVTMNAHEQQTQHDYNCNASNEPAANIIDPVSRQLEGSLRSSSQLGSSSQVSTINGDTYQLQLSKSIEENENEDIESGHKHKSAEIVSIRASLSAPTSMNTKSDDPPSTVSWHASNNTNNASFIPIAFMEKEKRNPSPIHPSPTADSPPNKRMPHPLDNAIITQPSDLTHTSCTISPNHASRMVLEERWGVPSDPRKLPLYLMPLAVVPLICAVGGVMILVLIGVIIASYM